MIFIKLQYMIHISTLHTISPVFLIIALDDK